MGALYKGVLASGLFSALLIVWATHHLFGLDAAVPATNGLVGAVDLLGSAMIGLVVTGLLVWATEYYTSTRYRPVKSIAQASQTGHATNIIRGLAISMEACALPVIIICVGILAAYDYAGLYGISLAATTMLALSGMIIALDAYGPITDNAGGIAEMVDSPATFAKSPTPSMRWVTPRKR